ncbi:hypothetical protein AKJ57_01900 [candidate division MSBL1 archaeon SCGC-AAA259A05]|uniref:Uncharacterized protein n=1 Tax=candidate division MSBL1 archaeon SCGC-AAA259A05 TaxID=1698259 RepID=A0A133UAM5_9EURY|nr:hypothetical protein AKJ57_01900 [candidate division MSBL1 archaeon SCGC-AAA259A05]
MELLKREKGFIFSLDATLALLISLIVLVGIAQIGGSSTTYKQFGYLQLERYANDSLRVLSLNGATKKAIRLANNRQMGEARKILRENLLSVLPEEIKFKMVVGKEKDIWLDNIYPTEDNQAWEISLENAGEKVASAQVTVETVELVQALDILTWTDDPEENQFIYNIQKPGWEVETTNDEEEFRDILENNIYPDWYPDVVFLPDVDNEWRSETVWDLLWFNGLSVYSEPEDVGGGVVAGGGTLNNNDGFLMRLIFGVDPWLSIWNPIENTIVPPQEDMVITDDEHYITLNFDENDEIPYGDTLYQYKYDLLGFPRTLAEWKVNDNEWAGLTAKRAWIEWNDYTFFERTVLFNTKLAQSWALGEGSLGWKRLATRAIQWCSREEPESEPVILYLWRGENVG